jgi:putative membrane protein
MTITSFLGRRVLRHGFVITTTFLTCTALQADHNDQHGNSTERFIQKAAMGGQMEVQMGQLAQQKGQAQEVKSLGETLVRDHTQANQRLQQLASTKNITLDQWKGNDSNLKSSSSTGSNSTSSPGDQTTSRRTGSDASSGHLKHQRELEKLQSQSGAEFDKTFVRMAIKDHKKDISEFERARTDVNDTEIKTFIDDTLPKLRNHLKMAQSAARAVGVDESTIAADRDDSDSAIGAPATGASGTRGSDKPSSPASATDKQSSSFNGSDRLNGATDADASGTIRHNSSPRAELDANVGNHSVSASADVDKSSQSASADVSTSKEHKVFQKGDGKVLGLSTDKNDGKFLGIIPDPKKKHEANVNADVNVNGHEASVGGSASTESGSESRNTETK